MRCSHATVGRGRTATVGPPTLRQPRPRRSMAQRSHNCSVRCRAAWPCMSTVQLPSHLPCADTDAAWAEVSTGAPRSHHKCPGGSGRSLPVAHALARPQTGLDCEHHQLGPVACVSFNIAGLTCASARCRGSTSSSAISWLERPVATHSMISRPRRPDPQPRVWLLARPDVPHSSMTRRVTEGANGEPSSTTTRIASSSLAGSASLSRRQLAPARRASKTYSSSSKVVGHDHAHAGQVGIRGRLGQQTQVVEDRHPDVASATSGRVRLTSAGQPRRSAASPTTSGSSALPMRGAWAWRSTLAGRAGRLRPHSGRPGQPAGADSFDQR
jgi:hypothetical protein